MNLYYFIPFFKVHAYIIGHIYEKMPCLIRKQWIKMKCIEKLDIIYAEVAHKYHLSLGKSYIADQFWYLVYTFTNYFFMCKLYLKIFSLSILLLVSPCYSSSTRSLFHQFLWHEDEGIKRIMKT